MPRPEERLLLVVHALLHRCYKLPFSNTSPVGSALARRRLPLCLLRRGDSLSDTWYPHCNVV